MAPIDLSWTDRSSDSLRPIAIGSASPTWRQSPPLCLPAFLIAIVLRASFLMIVPEAYFGTDSISYFEAADSLYNQGDLELAKRRRWLYPLFLVAMHPLPGSIAQASRRGATHARAPADSRSRVDRSPQHTPLANLGASGDHVGGHLASHALV